MNTILSLILLAQVGAILGNNYSAKLDQMRAAGVSEEFLANLPRAFIPIGTFSEYAYWQETDARTQSDSRVYCEFYGMHLARFPDKAHLDFVLFEGGSTVNHNWVDGIGTFTPSLYKWGNGQALSPDMPVDHYVTSVGLVVTDFPRGLFGRQESDLHRSICQLHVIPEEGEGKSTN